MPYVFTGSVIGIFNYAVDGSKVVRGWKGYHYRSACDINITSTFYLIQR